MSGSDTVFDILWENSFLYVAVICIIPFCFVYFLKIIHCFDCCLLVLLGYLFAQGYLFVRFCRIKAGVFVLCGKRPWESR